MSQRVTIAGISARLLAPASRRLKSAIRPVARAVTLLLAVGGALAFGGGMPASAQSPVLVNSIIDSSKTDRPPRFCWQALHIVEPGGLVVKMSLPFTLGSSPGGTTPPQLTLDLWRGGHLDFGSDMTETNIDIPVPPNHPPGGIWRLHRIPCPEPVANCTGGCGAINEQLLDARLVAIVNVPMLRARLSQLMGNTPGSEQQCPCSQNQPPPGMGSGPPSGGGGIEFNFGGFGTRRP